jgi:cytochrome c-type biogenesis protein CcmH/NrfG
MNSTEEALAAYDEALRLHPGNAAALSIHKGEILAQLKRYKVCR